MERKIEWAVLLCGIVTLLGCQTGSGVLTGLGGDAAKLGANIPMEVDLPGVPANEAEFDAAWAGLRGSPQGAAAGLILAALMLEGSPEVGQRCLMKTVAPEYLTSAGTPGSSLSLAISQFTGRAGIARSYVSGTAPTAYTLPAAPFTVVFYGDASGLSQGPGRTKLFVACSGADSRRPVILVETMGGYRVAEGSSLWLGVR
jgi:hypothetical protein